MDIDQAAELLRAEHERAIASLTPRQLRAVNDLVCANTLCAFTTVTVDRRLEQIFRKRAAERVVQLSPTA